MRRIWIVFVCAVVVSLVAGCGDDDAAAGSTNDPALVGRWDASSGADSFIRVNFTATTYETVMFVFDSESGMYEISTNMTSKGTYYATNGKFVPVQSHRWDEQSRNWVADVNSNPEVMAYTRTGSAIGSTMSLTIPDQGPMTFTKAAAYVANPSLDGVWKARIAGGTTTDYMELVVTGGSSFVMTMKRSKDGVYTQLTNEVSRGTTLFSAAGNGPGWMETAITSSQNWVSEGSTSLTASATVFSGSRSSFTITNSIYLVVGASNMVFKKVLNSDISNDSRMIGRWEGIGPEGARMVVTCTSNTYEMLNHRFDGEMGMYQLWTNMSGKGSYSATNGFFTPAQTHSWSDDTDNWVVDASDSPDEMAYTITGSGPGAILQIVSPEGTLTFTNVAAYVANDNVNGTWVFSINGTTKSETMTLEITGGSSFTMTMRVTEIGLYTNRIKEITLGSSLMSLATGGPGWMQSRMTSRQEWTATGSGTLGAVTPIFSSSLANFQITNVKYLVVGTNGMVFVKTP